jgi:hypothetical protein
MRILALVVGSLLLLFATATAAEVRTVCVYDPGGKSGDYYRIMEAWALEATTWGATVKLKAYTDEETASKDYEAGQCDGVVATGVRLQRFNRFPSTLEAVGALPTYDHLRQMLKTLATSQGAAKKLVSGEHETVGFIPLGAAYLFVNDRNINSVAELAGLRIATLDYDKASMAMVDRVGAIVVPADLGSFGPKFNNGDVDVCYSTASGYQPFELWRGMAQGGGVLRRPLAQATLQVMIRSARFPPGFGTKSRQDLYRRFDDAYAVIAAAEASIPAASWVNVSADSAQDWEEMFQGVRVSLKDSGAYDGAMLSVMKKVRCAEDGSRAECAESRE